VKGCRDEQGRSVPALCLGKGLDVSLKLVDIFGLILGPGNDGEAFGNEKTGSRSCGQGDSHGGSHGKQNHA